MMGMPALSILQPYAWLIVHGHKDIENRDWPTRFRGRILVHAGKKLGKRDYADDIESYAAQGIVLPSYDDMPRGGIIGAVNITGCVTESPSRWFFGKYGFTLENATACEFIPYRGQLGIFPVVLPPTEIEAGQSPAGEGRG